MDAGGPVATTSATSEVVVVVPGRPLTSEAPTGAIDFRQSIDRMEGEEVALPLPSKTARTP